MAAVYDDCSMCLGDFDGESHQALALPCNHIYCSQCLRKLQENNRKKCPTCRHDWKECDVDSLEKATDRVQSVSEVLLCREHMMPLYYFCDHCTEFLCTRCVIDKQTHCTFILISDALAQIKSSITAKCKCAQHETHADIDRLKNIISEVTHKRTLVEEFFKDLVSLQQQLSSLTESLQAILLKRSRDLIKVSELESTTAQINTDNVIAEVHSCLDVLKNVDNGKKFLLKFPELKSFICRIVCAFRETSQQRTPMKIEFESFISKLRDVEDHKPQLVESNQLPVVESDQLQSVQSDQLQVVESNQLHVVESAAARQYFGSCDQWVANNNSSYQAVLDALTKHRPAAVLVVATGQHSEDLLMKLLAALAGVDCEVKLRFLDSFYYGDDISRDVTRLKNLYRRDWNTECTMHPRLTEFVGDLDVAGQTTVLKYVTAVGLHCEDMYNVYTILKVINDNFTRDMNPDNENQKKLFLTRVHLSLHSYVNVNGAANSSASASTHPNPCVTFALHLPYLECGDEVCVPRFSITVSSFDDSSYTISAASLHLPLCILSPACAEDLAWEFTKGYGSPSRIYVSSHVKYVKHQYGVIEKLRKNEHFVGTYEQKLDIAWDIPV